LPLLKAPLPRPGAARVGIRSAKTPAVQSQNAILVVDDDQAMCEMLVEQLADYGLLAESTGSVAQALEILETGGFSAVVSDVQMAPRDGFSLLEAVRASASPVPVVLMSAFAAPGIERKALSAGAFAFLAKPFGEEQLLDVLGRLRASRA